MAAAHTADGVEAELANAREELARAQRVARQSLSQLEVLRAAHNQLLRDYRELKKAHDLLAIEQLPGSLPEPVLAAKDPCAPLVDASHDDLSGLHSLKDELRLTKEVVNATHPASPGAEPGASKPAETASDVRELRRSVPRLRNVRAATGSASQRGQALPMEERPSGGAPSRSDSRSRSSQSSPRDSPPREAVVPSNTMQRGGGHAHATHLRRDEWNDGISQRIARLAPGRRPLVASEKNRAAKATHDTTEVLRLRQAVAGRLNKPRMADPAFKGNSAPRNPQIIDLRRRFAAARARAPPAALS